MSTRAADDFAEIRRNRIRLTRICYRKLDLPTTECWCMKAGPNGEDIPCSEARDPTPWERVELGKPSAASELEPGPTSCRKFYIYECDLLGKLETASELTGRSAVSWERVEVGKPDAASELKTPDVVFYHIGDCAVWDGRDCDCGTTVRMPECVTYRWRDLEEGDMFEVGAPK